MSHSSHKALKHAFALIHAVKTGQKPPSKKKQKKELAKVVAMTPLPPPVFSVVYGTTPDRTTLWASWPLVISYRTAGSAPDERW